jgi:DnaJ-class molecular chaperone
MLYTHYDYLDLAPGASMARIEEAYQRLKRHLNGDKDKVMERLIHEAHAVLSDPAQRKAYDNELLREANAADEELKELLDQRGMRFPRRVQDVPAPLVAAMSAWAA